MGYNNQEKNREKLWALREECLPEADRAVAKSIEDELGVTDTFSRLLSVRGFKSAESASSFFRMEEELLHSPFLLKDMDKAVDVLLFAIESKKKIMIYGDYDVDGVTSVSILYLYIQSLGGKADYYIPDRAGEGYGMSSLVIDRMAEEGVNLIVTVDTGITAENEIAHAKELGIEVLVTDHHECHGILPAAAAIVNPKRPDCDYPFKSLAGVGVVFKLLCACEEKRSNGDTLTAVRKLCRDYCDLVALGTIADVMPIVDENRLIVNYGLAVIEKNERIGLSALINAAMQRPDGTTAPRRPRITSAFIGYTIAPRINAAGRITNASVAVELFLTEDRERADELASKLCEINRFRQAEENKIATAAYEMIEEDHDFENDPVIVLEHDSWHHGVIGIVASRITERFGLPSILISYDKNMGDVPLATDMGKGSGRSIKGLNLVDALVSASDLLEKFGGHELAAGLSLTRGNVDSFRRKINEYARDAFKNDGLPPVTLDYDMELYSPDLTLDFAEDLLLLEPCGVANPVPLFKISDVILSDVIPVSGGKHTKLVLKPEGKSVVAMCFSRSPGALGVFAGDRVDILCNMDINTFGGGKTLQLIVKDIRKSEVLRAAERKEEERYLEIKNGAEILPEENAVPTRLDMGDIFTLIRREVRIGNSEMSLRSILTRLLEEGKSVTYAKVKFAIAILSEMNIMSIKETSFDVYSFELYNTTQKTDLERSGILRRLRSQLKR